MSNILLLGSASQSRQVLLKEAHIPFILVKQDANETACDWSLPLPQLVERIALHKMDHVLMPQGKEGEIRYVLTADTLTQDGQGNLHGKPIDRADALAKLKSLRHGARVGTGFCLDKKMYQSGTWNVQLRIVRFVEATCIFEIPDAWLDKYFSLGRDIGASGGMRIEGFGSLFVKSIQGAYTTILGLPMCELRESLENVGFFNA